MTEDTPTSPTDQFKTREEPVPVPSFKNEIVPYLVVLAGDSVGKVIRLEPGKNYVAGRTRHCDIYFDCENISREHVRFHMNQQGITTVSDLNSTNGTLVNGKKVDKVVLNDGDRICMGNVILKYSLKDSLEYGLHQDLYTKATRDPLTMVFNKQFFLDVLRKEFAHHRRHHKPLSVIIFDLDDFKRLNDTYGHLNGDVVLKTTAREINSCLREEDIFARFGGEEFVALFRYTDRESAIQIGQKLLELVRTLEFASSEVQFSVSATAGVATLENENFDSSQELLEAADRNLYLGKQQGKDQVIG